MTTQTAPSSTVSPQKAPTPYSFATTGGLIGLDGSWSALQINIGDDGSGTKGQTFNVLVSTSGSGTYVPAAAESWCNTTACSTARGLLPYHAKDVSGLQSTVVPWSFSGVYSLNLEESVGYSPGNGSYGFANVGLGPASTLSDVVQSQVVVEIDTMDFYAGMFGLSDVPLHFAFQGSPTFIQTFRNDSIHVNIPSLSYGYTAGASYKNKAVDASLVLGGYDSSRFSDENTISISMPQGNSSLIVAIESISVNSSNGGQYSSISSGGFFALIDSTLPYLWLPQEVCDNLANTFSLHYDPETNLYQITNETNHDLDITFKLTNDISESIDYVDIVLPFDAFNLVMSPPLVNKSTPYFPIKRSPTGNFILGRAFLQETYLVVDYERKRFNVSQAIFNDPMPSPAIIAIQSTDTVIVSSGGSDSSSRNSSSLSTGAIAGIAVAGVVVLIIIGIIVVFFRRKRTTLEYQNRPDDQPITQISSPPLQQPPPYDDPSKRRISELEEQSRTSSQGYGGYELESPDFGALKQGGYFAPAGGRERSLSDPGFLVELPADYGGFEINASPQSPAVRTLPSQRPSYRRNRSNGSNSIGTTHSLPGESGQIASIAEDPNEGNSPHLAMNPQVLPVLHSPASNLYEEPEYIDSQQHPEGSRDIEQQRRPLLVKQPSQEHYHQEQPHLRTRMSVDEAAGLEGGEPGPVLHEITGAVKLSRSRASSITITEKDD